MDQVQHRQPHPTASEIHTLSLHDALPICINKVKARAAACPVDRSAITARPNTIPAAALSPCSSRAASSTPSVRSEEHTSELQSRFDLVCRLLLEKTNHRTKAKLP